MLCTVLTFQQFITIDDKYLTYCYCDKFKTLIDKTFFTTFYIAFSFQTD